MFSSVKDSIKSLSKSISSDDSTISSPNPINFIEDALFCSNPTLALSYSDPDQKWMIRQHLISLFQDYPSLKPSVAVYTHNDGTEVKLLNANGDLPIFRPAPPVPLTIWVPELYPRMAPIVYVDPGNSPYPIYETHPFSDPSGATTCSYLRNWHLTGSDLSGLARNLTKLFSHNHPFYYSGSPISTTHPSLVSKTEAIDRLAAAIHYDAAAIATETEEEIEKLTVLQAELRGRCETVDALINGLEEERRRLKGITEKLCDESDKVLNWLKVHDGGSCLAIDDAFEGVDRESEIKLECLAADLAAEDLMYALEKAAEEGVLGFEVYMKQLRVLAREQFLHRAKMAKIETQKGY